MEASERKSFHKLNVEICGWREEKIINASSEGKARAISSAWLQLAAS